MRCRKFFVVASSVFVFSVFVFLLVSVGFRFTGFAVFRDSGSWFDDGVYNNTFYNFSGFVQVGNNESSDTVEMAGNESGLISYWRMNESSWSGVSGEVKDFLLGNNGTAIGGATTVLGLFGNAGSFDGVDDYVNIENRDELNPIGGDFTITGWTKSFPRAGGVANQWQLYVAKRTTDAEDGYYVGLNQGSGLNFMVGDGTNRYDTRDGDGYVPIVYNEWFHFAAVVDRTGNKISLYVNGSLMSSMTLSTLGDINNSASLNIGRDKGQIASQNGYPANGSVDEVAVWNRLLSVSEIQSLYEKGVNFSVQLTTGDYESGVKDAGSIVNWTNISWNGLVVDSLGELPNNKGVDSGANMSGNVLLMHMNEASGVIEDTSGEGNNGTESGGITYGVSGKFNNALSFDGSDDYLNIPHDASLNLGNVMTIEAWVYPVSLSNRYTIYSTRVSNPAGSFQLEVGTGNSHTNVVAVAGVNTWIVESENNVVNLNEWNHIVYTRNGTGVGNHKVYVNGQEKTLQTTSAYDFVDNSNVKMIGAGTSLLAMHYFPGKMDEVAVYNRAFSANEVLNHYNRNGTSSGLKFQIRTSNDNSSWSDYIGSNGSVGSYYDFPQDLGLTSRYLQYKVYFENLVAKLYNVTIGYNVLSALSVSLNSPEDNYLMNSFGLSANCSGSSVSGLVNATLYHDFSGTWEAQTTNSVSGTSDATSFSFIDVTTGTHLWNCLFCDVNGSCEFASSNRTIILDNLAPVVSLVSPEDNYTENLSSMIDFVFNATDERVASLDCSLFVDDSEVASNSSVVSGMITTISNSFSDGNYSWYINCSDGVNFGLSGTRNISVEVSGDYVPFWAKANTHTHTTNSDGDSSPSVVVGLYRNLGYNVLAITDHGYVTDCTPFTNLSANFICVSSEEWTSTKHITRINVSVPYNNAAQYMQDAVNAADVGGGFSIAAHPNWSSTIWTVSDLTNLQNYTAMEIYNKVIERLSPNAYADSKWDEVLITGKKIFGVAADDIHLVNVDLGYGFTKVYMPEFTQQTYIDSMKAGYFYSSQGPSMDGQAFELVCDGLTTYHMGESANCSAVELIANLFATNSSFTMQSISLVKDGVVINVTTCSSQNCSFDYSQNVASSGYYRLQAIDSGNKQIWSNPIWVTKIALPIVMVVNSPENNLEILDYTPLLNVSLNQDTALWYSLNGASNVTLCSNCSSYTGYPALVEGVNALNIYSNNSDNIIYSKRVLVNLDFNQFVHENFDDNSSVESVTNVFWSSGKMSLGAGEMFGNFVLKPIFLERSITSFIVSWIENNTAGVKGEGQRTPIILKYRINNSDWISLDGLGNYIVSGTEISGLNGNNFSMMFDFEKNNDTPIDLLEFNLSWTEFTVPLISNVGESTTTSGATITWETDTASNSTLEYGDSVLLGTVISDSDLVTSHSMTISGLNSNNVYYYKVRSCTIDSCAEYPQLPYPVDSFTTKTVAAVNPPATSGGGGGGGGGGSFAVSSTGLEVEGVSVIVSLGEEKSLRVSVKNNGKTSANKCSLVAGEGYGDYVDSGDLFNIGIGEIVEFEFVLRALGGVENLKLEVRCLDNVSGVVPLSIVVLRPKLDVSILGIGFDSDDRLKVDYSVEPTGDSDSVLYFRVLDSDGVVVGEVIEEISLVLGEVYEGSVLIGLDDVDEGMLRVVVGDSDVSFVEEDFVYGGGVGVTGFASLDWDGDFSYIGIILVVFLVLAGLLIRRIWKLKKKH